MLRLLLIGFSFLCIKTINAQENAKYFVSFYNLNSSNFDQTKNLLERVTQATSIQFDKIDSVFTITTDKILDKNIVTGKMLKNYFPIKTIIKEGELPEPFPLLINTGNPEQDALMYEEKKNNWVKKYPKEYKKMTETLSK
jgi:hypothetical protein